MLKIRMFYHFFPKVLNCPSKIFVRLKKSLIFSRPTITIGLFLAFLIQHWSTTRIFPRQIWDLSPFIPKFFDFLLWRFFYNRLPLLHSKMFIWYIIDTIHIVFQSEYSNNYPISRLFSFYSIVLQKRCIRQLKKRKKRQLWM